MVALQALSFVILTKYHIIGTPMDNEIVGISIFRPCIENMTYEFPEILKLQASIGINTLYTRYFIKIC